MDEETVRHLRAVLEKGLMGAGVLETDDCRATYEAPKIKGGEFMQPPQDRSYGVKLYSKMVAGTGSA